MENRDTTTRNPPVSHKAWRRIAKKERRRRLRRQAAKEREAEEARLRATLERSADYLNWLKVQEEEEEARKAREEVERFEQEQLWLEREAKAQEEWKIIQEKKAKARQIKLEQEELIRREFEAKQEAIRQKEEKEKRKQEELIRQEERLQKEIDDYIDEGIKTPETLREIIESQPNKELCPFFSKTGACRYGESCSRNHRRVWLSKIILIPGFYTHFSLEKTSTGEYDTDVALEFETSEMRQHYKEFYEDVVPELESFGRIRTLKCCSNSEMHLRGNLYVEYYSEREAAKALRNLKGRWYAGRKLNCEFVSLISWRSAVCGMLKCPKGRACNFLHTFRNPHDDYDIKSPPRRPKGTHGIQDHNANGRKSDYRERSKWEDSVRSHGNEDEPRNWRWSESPEMQINFEVKDKRSSKDRKDYSYRDSERSSKRSSRSTPKSDKYSTKYSEELTEESRQKNSDRNVKKSKRKSQSPRRRHHRRRRRRRSSSSSGEKESSGKHSRTRMKKAKHKSRRDKDPVLLDTSSRLKDKESKRYSSDSSESEKESSIESAIPERKKQKVSHNGWESSESEDGKTPR